MEIIFTPFSLIITIIATIFIFTIINLILIKRYAPGRKDELAASHLEELFKSYTAEYRNDQREFMKYLSGEIRESSRFTNDQLASKFDSFYKAQRNELVNFRERLDLSSKNLENQFTRLEKLVTHHLEEIRKSNEAKLEEMRVVVDEKLTATLENRLGSSFKQVSERLEEVHKGLGEMQNLATGVGDLKKVLTNVKTRGTWGEIQLKNLVEQILSPGQYEYNYEVLPGSGKRVELAITFPGREDNSKIFLPVDSKFPLEDYYKLSDPDNPVTPVEKQQLLKAIETRIKLEAKQIREKYIHPGITTDFAVMFLPVEGFYAEVLNIPGLPELLQTQYKIVIAGPTTFAAILNSFQLGFRTLAIEKRSGEVWKLLSNVKSEFFKFGDLLEKTQQKLDQASKSIGDASRKTRTISRHLDKVEEYNNNKLES